MPEHDREVLNLYNQYRVGDQIDGFYKPRSNEYKSAYRQSMVIKGLLLALGGAAGALAGANVAGERALWSVLAAAFPALSTALVAYDGLFLFDRVGKLYSDVVDAVRVVDIPSGADVQAAAVSAYIATIEGILLREQGQWGQLTGDIELQAPPSPK